MTSIIISYENTAMFGINTGPIVTIDGHKCCLVVRHSPTKSTLQRIGTSQQFDMSRDEFIAGWISGRVVLEPTNVGRRGNTRDSEVSLPAVDAKSLKVGVWRQYFVLEQLKLNPDTASKAERRAAIRSGFEKARQDPAVPIKYLRREKLPSMSAVYRWMKAWSRELGPVSLTSAWINCGRRGKRLHDIYERIIEKGIYDFIATANQQRNDAIADIEDNLLTASQTEAALKDIPPPTRATLYRRIRALGGEVLLALQKGKRYAHRRYSPVLGSFKATRPLECVQIDTTVLDRINVDLIGSTILSRAHLTTAIDVATAMILAFEISLTAPSSDDIRRILRKAMLPKDPARLKAMGVKMSWPACGRWNSATTDQGKVYIAADTRSTFYRLDIEHVINPPYTPNHKPYIEIVQKTFNNFGIHGSSGSTMSNPAARGERKPDDENLLSIDMIEEEITRMICDVYHTSTHSRLGCSPLEMWDRLTELYPVNLLKDENTIRQITEKTTTRTVSHEGIEMYGIRYNSYDLANLHRAAIKRVKHTVHYDPSDISTIRVEVPGTHREIVVGCVDKMYAGLDFREYKLLKKYSKSATGELYREAFIRNRAALVRRNRAIAGRRPAHMLPYGYKPKPVGSETPVEMPAEIANGPAKKPRKHRQIGSRNEKEMRQSSAATEVIKSNSLEFRLETMSEEHIQE